MRLVPPGLHFGDGTNGPGKLCGLLQGLVEGRYCFFFWFGGFLQVPNLWFLKWLLLRPQEGAMHAVFCTTHGCMDPYRVM